MEFAPDGRLFVAYQTGQLRVVKNGSLLSTPFVSVSVNSSGDRGLLGVAFDPNLPPPAVVPYTATAPSIHNRISRFKANGDVADRRRRSRILDFDNLSSATNHNGGALHFGADGKLYASHGENANSANSQSMTNLLGKMIRMNPVPDPTAQIPTDNPFFSSATGKNRLIWTRGLRNPFTSVQPGTGLIYINDVGEGPGRRQRRAPGAISAGPQPKARSIVRRFRSSPTPSTVTPTAADSEGCRLPAERSTIREPDIPASYIGARRLLPG